MTTASVGGFGRVALVTGSGSGMGRATATRLVQDGWTVLGLDLVPSSVSGNSTGTLIPVVADVIDRTAVRKAVSAHLPPQRRLDLVANVAGIYPPSTLDTFTESVYRQVFDVNVLGTLNVIAECRPYLVDGSVVVNFASVDAFAVSPGQLVYGAAKAAVVMLTKQIALELAPHGVRVIALAPGWVDTPGNASTGRMEQAASSVPLGRVAQPEEIAEWVVTLADRSGFLTGETIVLSGGDVMR